MGSAQQISCAAENRVLRKLLDEALTKLADLTAQLREKESLEVENITLEHSPRPILIRPAEVECEFGGEEKRENEALHHALASTQFRLFHTAGQLKLAERRGKGLGTDGSKRPSTPVRVARGIITIYHEVLCLVGPHAKLVSRANQARDARDFAAAAQLYGEACTAMPNHFRLWMQQGNMAKDAGLFHQAQRSYDAARCLQGDNADTHLQIGHLCKLFGDTAGAAHAYCLSLSLAPDQHNAYRELEALGYIDAADRIRSGARR